MLGSPKACFRKAGGAVWSQNQAGQCGRAADPGVEWGTLPSWGDPCPAWGEQAKTLRDQSVNARTD